MADKFNPSGHMMKLKGKEYLPVNARVAWFREENPIGSGWGIRTRVIAGGYEAGYAVCEAEIVDAEGRIIAVAQKSEDKAGFADYIEKASTGAVGRALALCGYGTLDAQEMAEGDVCDSPVEAKATKPIAPTNGKAPAPAAAPKFKREDLEAGVVTRWDKAVELGLSITSISDLDRVRVMAEKAGETFSATHLGLATDEELIAAGKALNAAIKKAQEGSTNG